MPSKGRMLTSICLVVLSAALAAVAQQPIPPSQSGGRPTVTPAKADAKTSDLVPTAANPAAPASAASPAAAVKGKDKVPAETRSGNDIRSGAETTGYIIGEQDVLAINVWREPEMSSAVVVRPDGMITLPLVNDIYVVGMTTDQLKSFLTEKLKPFITVPQVTVSVREVNSRKVYVMGPGAAREGPFRINGSMTILQMIAEAGGLRDFAKRKKIYVMRAENGKLKKYQFNYDEVIRGVRQEQNILLQPGDTVVVP